jgi:hypothetical protein
MANHVSAYVEIQFKTKEDTTKFLEWLDYEPDPEKRPEDTTFFTQIDTCTKCLIGNLYDNLDDTIASWIENVGSKWWYLDDVSHGETDVYLNWTSAWDFPEKLFWKLTDFLRIEFPGAKVEATFEDESFCFIGACASNQQFRDIEYFYPESEFFEDPKYKDEDDHWTDDFYDEMIDKKAELLDEVLSFTEQIID